jgi:hypothetical protein
MKIKYSILLLLCLNFFELYSQTQLNEDAIKCPTLKTEIECLRKQNIQLDNAKISQEAEIEKLKEENKSINDSLKALRLKRDSLFNLDSTNKIKIYLNDSLYNKTLRTCRDSIHNMNDTIDSCKKELKICQDFSNILKDNNKKQIENISSITKEKKSLSTKLEQTSIELYKKNKDFESALNNFIIPKYSKQINRVIGLSEEESIKKTFKPIATYKYGNGYKTKKLKANRIENLSYVGFSFWLDTSKYNGAKYNYKVYPIALFIKKKMIENTISVSDYGSGSFTLPSTFFTKGTRYKIEILNANGTLMYTYFFRFKEKKSTTSISMGYSVSQFNRN